MKEYLQNWLPRIKNFSMELDQLSRIYNQPWVIINDLSEHVKLIFQPKGKLIVSKNGEVSNGTWELVSMANSVLLEIDGRKKMYKHQFLDKGIMILKLDGHSGEYFALANENVIPDMDVERYLKNNYSTSTGQDNIPNKSLSEDGNDHNSEKGVFGLTGLYIFFGVLLIVIISLVTG